MSIEKSKCYLIFADLPSTPADSPDPLQTLFDSKFTASKYTVYQETSSSGKEHVHACIVTPFKKDTLAKLLTTHFPNLKAERKGRGGSHKYGIKEFPSQYKNSLYDEYPQDYILKDSKHRCGDLWSQTNSNLYHSSSTDNPLPNALDCPEDIARYTRLKSFLANRPSKNPNAPKTVPNKESKDERLQSLLASLMKEDISYFCGNNKVDLDQDRLINEIIMFYRKYGKPSNRRLTTVIAEQILWYSPIVAPQDPHAHKDLVQAIKSEMDSIVYRR